MHDLQCIGRFGPRPWPFTRRQRQQKPIGCCLTIQQLVGPDSEPKLRLQHEPQFSHSAGEPQHFQPQHLNSAGEP